MGLEMSKRGPACSYRFHLMSAKHYEDIAYHGEMQAVTPLENQPSFTKFMAL